MRSIPKATQKQIETLIEQLYDCADKVGDEIDAYNNVVEQHRSAIDEAITAYNEKVSELCEIYQGLADEAGSYYMERSEKWREGEAGEKYAAWAEQLNEAVSSLADLKDIDIETIEEPDGLLYREQWERPENSPDEM